MRSVRGILTIAAVASSLGCSSGSDYGATTASVQRHPSTVAAATGSTGTVGTTGGSSTGGGTTGGSTSGGGSTTGGIPDAGCGAGEEQFTSYAYDLYKSISSQTLVGNPAVGVVVTTDPVVSPSVTTDANGLFSACVVAGQTFTTVFSSSAYIPMQMESLNLDSDQSFLAQYGGIPMITPTLYSLIQGKLTSYNPDLGGAMVAVTSLSDEAICSRTGWVFSAQSVDGGPPATPWPTAYIDYFGDAFPNGPTTEAGIALIYNIDPSAPAITVTAESTDAGVGCAPVPNTGFTQQMPVSSAVLGFYPILVP